MSTTSLPKLQSIRDWISLGLLAACAAPAPLPDLLGEALASPAMMLVQEPQLGAVARPIYEVRVYPVVAASHISVGPPPRVEVLQVPSPDRTSRLLRIRFTTGGTDGNPTRNAWIVISPVLITPPVNWGSNEEPVYQMVQLDTVLPFPAGQATSWQDGAFTREADSGVIWYQHDLHLTAPIYLQMIVQAPQENVIGYVTSFAHGLIPGDG